MKSILAMAVAGVFTFGLAAAVPAQAQSVSHKTDVTSDFSSAKKKTSKKKISAKHRASRNYYNGRQRGYVDNDYRSSAYGWGGGYRNSYAADPSFAPNGRPYRPSVYSPCQIDLGYGRFTSCDR